MEGGLEHAAAARAMRVQWDFIHPLEAFLDKRRQRAR